MFGNVSTDPVDHPGASSRAQIAKERFFWDTLYIKLHYIQGRNRLNLMHNVKNWHEIWLKLFGPYKNVTLHKSGKGDFKYDIL